MGDDGSTLTLLSSPILTLIDLGNSAVPVGTKFTLIAYDGAWNDGIFSGHPDDSLIYGFGGINWWINYNDTSAGSNFPVDAGSPNTVWVTITATAVPEPSTWALNLLGLAGLGVIALRKRFFRA